MVHRGFKHPSQFRFRGNQPKVGPTVRKYVSRRLAAYSEMKHHFQTRALASVGTTEFALDLSGIDDGDTGTTRDGNIVNPYFLDVRMRIIASEAEALGALRLIIIKTRDAGTPALSEILQDVTVPQVLISQYDNVMFQDVLWDRTIDMTTPVNEEARQKFIRVRIPRKRLPHVIAFDEGATTAQKGKLWILGIALNNTQVLSLSLESVLKFKDQ